jgi:hypothetical protein
MALAATKQANEKSEAATSYTLATSIDDIGRNEAARADLKAI